MSRSTTWNNASPPNYETNKDKLYPYSEVLDLGSYGQLVKIPHCHKNLIQHVDYFGAGRFETSQGYIGFPDCYNVNFECELTPAGIDGRRKIPNRIPIPEDPNMRSEYYTSKYIKDNSVLTVTYTPYYGYKKNYFVKDIARIVNDREGKIIMYGMDPNNSDDSKLIDKINQELKREKRLFYCPIYMLPDDLQLTYYKTCYRVYLSLNVLEKDLYNSVEKGEYEAALILTVCLSDVYCCNAIGDVVTKLLENKVQNIMEYAHKLWTNNAKHIVCKYFPIAFKLILNGDLSTIVNKNYNQGLVKRAKENNSCCSCKQSFD